MAAPNLFCQQCGLPVTHRLNACALDVHLVDGKKRLWFDRPECRALWEGENIRPTLPAILVGDQIAGGEGGIIDVKVASQTTPEARTVYVEMSEEFARIVARCLDHKVLAESEERRIGFFVADLEKVNP